MARNAGCKLDATMVTKNKARMISKAFIIDPPDCGGYGRACEAFPYLAWISISAVCLIIWRGIRDRDQGSLLLLVWLTVPLLFFSLVPTKLTWYVVPILPALALAIAVLFRAVVPRHSIPETFFLGALVLVVALWNITVLKPVDLSQDVKMLGEHVVHVTPAHETIASRPLFLSPFSART